MAFLANPSKMWHITQVHDMWPFGPLVCSYKCVIHIYCRINKKFLNNIAIFPKSNDVYFDILSLKTTTTALHLFAINIHQTFTLPFYAIFNQQLWQCLYEIDFGYNCILELTVRQTLHLFYQSE